MTADVVAGAHSIAAWRGMPMLRSDDWRAEVVAESEGERAVVRYVFDGVTARRDAATPVYIAKFYEDDTGARTFEHMRGLAQRLAGLELRSGLAVPRALHYDPSLRMLLQTEACGEPLTRLFADRQASVAVSRCARALAALHRLPLADAAVKSMSEHVADLIRPHPRELAVRHPAAAGLIAETLRGLGERAAGWHDDVRPVPLHRDFHPRQLLLEGDCVWVLDWDLFAAGDPAFDVAYFIVYLTNHLEAAPAAALSEGFVAAYLGYGGDPTVPQRLDTYAAFNYLRRACRRWRLRDTGWRDEFALMLDRLRSCDIHCDGAV